MFDDDSPIPDKPGAFMPRPARLPETREELTAAEMAEAQRLAQRMTRVGNIDIDDISYLSELRKVMDDAMFLRAYSVRKNRQSGLEEIYNPVMFEKSMARRTAIVATAVRLVREIWNQKATEDFYRAVLDAASMESPAMRRRIIDRLQELNSPVAEAVSRWPITVNQ